MCSPDGKGQLVSGIMNSIGKLRPGGSVSTAPVSTDQKIRNRLDVRRGRKPLPRRPGM